MLLYLPTYFSVLTSSTYFSVLTSSTYFSVPTSLSYFFSSIVLHSSLQYFVILYSFIQIFIVLFVASTCYFTCQCTFLSPLLSYSYFNIFLQFFYCSIYFLQVFLILYSSIYIDLYSTFCSFKMLLYLPTYFSVPTSLFHILAYFFGSSIYIGLYYSFQFVFDLYSTLQFFIFSYGFYSFHGSLQFPIVQAHACVSLRELA